MRSVEASANLVAHLLAELLPPRRPLLFGDIKAVEDIEIVENGITVAGHCQNTKQFAGRSGGTGDFPSANGIGAGLARREAAQLGHVGGRERSTDRLAEIVAQLSKFRAGHDLGFPLGFASSSRRLLAIFDSPVFLKAT